jgi:pimeloyl-ACP methyl ester carboxylesterase
VVRPAVRYLQDDAGNRVAYTVHGQGPNLVLPTWWISYAEKDWDHPSYRAFLTDLGEHFRVIRYDRPGVGLSDREVAPQTMGSEVRLLATVIDTTVGQHSTLLFAFSCGCPIALAYAAEYPNRVEKICVYGGYLSGADVATPDVRAAMVALVRAHWGAGSRVLADIFLPDQPREELDAASRQQRDSATAESAAALLELTYRLEASKVISSVSADMLVLHRIGDRAIPCEAGRKLASASAGVPFFALEGQAHPPWVGERKTILEPAVAFLTGKPYEEKSYQPVDDEENCRLDVAHRSLNMPDGNAALTALEFSVMRYLVENSDRVVTREDLLEHVWKTPFSGSNKIDALIRALRKKLGAYARSVETVSGHGYIFRGWKK